MKWNAFDPIFKVHYFIYTGKKLFKVGPGVQEHRSYENHTRRLRLFERRWKVGTIGQRKHHDHAWRQIITKAWLPSLLWRVSSNFPSCMFSLCFCESIMSWFVHCAGRVALAQDELFRTLQTDQPTEQVFSKWKVHGNIMIVGDCCARSSHEVMYVSIQVNVQSTCK